MRGAPRSGDLSITSDSSESVPSPAGLPADSSPIGSGGPTGPGTSAGGRDLEVGPLASAGTNLSAPVRPPRATLDSVAARAGVSRQTVSNVINLPHLVKSETADRVAAAIADLEYRPNRAAQQLRTRRSRVIGLRVELAAGDKVFDRFLHALTEAAGALDYRIMLYTADDDQAEIATYTELSERWDIDGVVLTTTHPGDVRTAHLAGAGLPCVTFGRPWDDSDHHAWVDVDGAAGTAAATWHLLGTGRQRVGFLGWPTGSGVGDDRLAGWSRTLRAAGRAVGEPERSVNEVRAAREAAERLLDRERPDGIVCASDVLALGAVAAITGRGLRVGPGIAVVGFDDTDLAQLTGLSSVAQPLHEVAAHCIRLITQDIEKSATDKPGSAVYVGGPVPPEQLMLSPTLVVRDSSPPTPT